MQVGILLCLCFRRRDATGVIWTGRGASDPGSAASRLDQVAYKFAEVYVIENSHARLLSLM
jgi:hypothetical protein